MVKGIVLALVFTLITGCSTINRPEKVKIVTVKVPVNQCPVNYLQIVKPIKPKLAIESITEVDEKNPGKVVKAYKATVKQLQGYSEELEKGNDAFRDVCKNLQDGKDNKDEVK